MTRFLAIVPLLAMGLAVLAAEQVSKQDATSRSEPPRCLGQDGSTKGRSRTRRALH